MLFNYQVSGMTCGHCANHIVEEVSEIAEVQGANADYETGRLTIEADERPPFDSVVEAVSEAGSYTVIED